MVCYKEGRGDFRVRSYCNAPQCQKCMHVSKGWDCFAVFHSKPQANFADVYSNVFRKVLGFNDEFFFFPEKPILYTLK